VKNLKAIVSHAISFVDAIDFTGCGLAFGQNVFGWLIVAGDDFCCKSLSSPMRADRPSSSVSVASDLLKLWVVHAERQLR
jgi:hypothetical protein